MIELQKVSKSYNKGKVKAVDELTLTIQKGELFGFLGPNGAGKTTTIKLMVGLLKPDQGTLHIGGLDIQKDPLKTKALIGFVPDEPMLYERMTGIQYLSFIADVFGLSQEERKYIEELTQIFEIKDPLQDVISSYSHGMKQKISVIAALLHKPEILILDEPNQSLDPKAAFTLKEYMRQLCELGKTVFFSTHVMEVAEKLCDRVGIISHGKLIAAAPLEELKEKAGEKEASLEKLFLELTDDSIQTR